ncbi:HAD family phosphatase [Naasia sp. SYSU D00948]|uniref:HAD family hydrolase n=1 Tax=Naasia sp. SYSU D00948 TaxID=2817379 RepID=UPI001B3031A9|nr:HAD-IA family hydrolase [Naasia sp. SYSU D00948]
MSSLPSLDGYQAVLFDLDGVLTPTADLHMHAWRAMFEELFTAKRVSEPYTDDDYFRYLDGKKRYDGVAGLLESRGIVVPWGTPDDPSSADTVCGIGNRKNDVFSRILDEEGVEPYPGSLALLDRLRAEGTPMAVVSSSKNAERVLVGAHLRDLFPVVVDGEVATREHLAGKPAGDMFVYAARALGSDPAASVVVEDAISGVAAGRAGNFGLVIGVNRGVGEKALKDAGADVVVEDLGVLVKGES